MTALAKKSSRSTDSRSSAYTSTPTTTYATRSVPRTIQRPKPVTFSFSSDDVWNFDAGAVSTQTPLQEVYDDRRRYNPSRAYVGPVSSRPRAARVGHKFQPRVLFSRAWEAFNLPKHVGICIRRKIRKQIMFALKKRGKGARAKRHRFNSYSRVRC